MVCVFEHPVHNGRGVVNSTVSASRCTASVYVDPAGRISELYWPWLPVESDTQIPPCGSIRFSRYHLKFKDAKRFSLVEPYV